MVILRKLDTSNLSIEAYEQYGDHDSDAPSILVTKAWAHREQVIDRGQLPDGMQVWCTKELLRHATEMQGLEDTLRGFPRTGGVR